MEETEVTLDNIEIEPEGQPEPTDDKEATEKVQQEETTDAAVQQAESPEKFDWSRYRDADRYKGRDVQEVIDYLNIRERQYGEQARELGELRRLREQYDAMQKQATGQPPPAKKTTFTEGQTFEFAKKWNDQPLDAVREFMVPHLAEELTPMIMEKVQHQLGPAMQNYARNVATDTEYAAFVRNHPEVETDHNLRMVVSQIMEPEYLGDVPFEQAYQLAVLGRDEPDLFSSTCYLMRQGISFEKAKRYAELERNAPVSAETKKQQLKDEVAGVRQGAKTSTRKSGTSEPEIVTMDDVRASMD